MNATLPTPASLPKMNAALLAEEQGVVSNFALGTEALQWKNLYFLRGYQVKNDEKFYGVMKLSSKAGAHADMRAYELGYRFVARPYNTRKLGYFCLADRAAIEVFDVMGAAFANKIIVANEKLAVMTVDEAKALLKVDSLELEESPAGTATKTGFVGVSERPVIMQSGTTMTFVARYGATHISTRRCPVRAAVDRARYIGLLTERDVNVWPSLPAEDKSRLRAEARADVLEKDVVALEGGGVGAASSSSEPADGVRPQRKTAKVAEAGFKALRGR